MDIASLPKVECVILHNQFNPLDDDAVLKHVQRLSENLKYSPEVQVMDGSSDLDMQIHVGGNRVLVRQENAPLDQEEFKEVLTTPYTRMVFPNAHETVHRHQAFTVVSIAKGLFDLSPEAALFKDTNSATTTGFVTDQEALRAMIFCRELVKTLIGQNPASAIHWRPSDNLVPQDFFERHCGNDMMFLNIRPFLASTSGRIGEGLPLGMVLSGSQWLVGRSIEFEEAPVSFPWMMEAAIAFITLCQARGSLLAHMDTFSLEGRDWRVGVMHEISKGLDAWEKVKLVAVHVPEFGILDDADSKFTPAGDNRAAVRDQADVELAEIMAANTRLHSEPNHLNPEDTMDLAILERLRKRQLDDGMPPELVDLKKTEEKAAEEEQPAQVQSPEYSPPLEPWTGNVRKADLESLRALARVGLNKGDEDEEEPQEKASLMGKLGGIFGKR